MFHHLTIFAIIILLSSSFFFGVFSAEDTNPGRIKTASLVSITKTPSSASSSSFLSFETLNPAKDYFFENCKLDHEEKNGKSFSILIPHQPRSAKKSDKRHVVCLRNKDQNEEYPEIFGQESTQILIGCKNRISNKDNNDHDDISYTITIEEKQPLQKIQSQDLLGKRNAQIQSTITQDTSSLFSVPPLEYVSYDAIVNRMKKLEKNYPSLIQTFTLQKPNSNNEDYKTSSGSRSIWGAKLSSSCDAASSNSSSSSSRIIQNDPRKQEIVIVGGTHAREWIAAEVAIGLLESLVNLYQNNENARNLIDFFEFIFVPVLNPDGYEYSRNSDRYWRKNRRNLVESNPSYFGVDINRNFPYQWGLDSGSSGDYWDETFRGPSSLSEIESQAMVFGLFRNRSLVSVRPAFVFSLHSYGGSYLIPPGYASNVYTPTYNIVQPLLSDSIKAIFERSPKNSPESVLAVLREAHYSSEFSVEPAWQLYPVSGDMIDWVHFEFGQMPCTTVELRPTNSEGCCDFQLYAADIPPSVMEQVGVLLGTIDTIKFVIQEKIVKNNTINSYDPETTYWWRKLDDQNNVNSVFTTNMSQIFEDKKNTLGWPTLESYFEATETKSSQNSSSVQFYIGPLLRYQNQLREKFFDLQNSNAAVSPWIAPNLDTTPTSHTFSRISSSADQKWFTSSSLSSSLGEYYTEIISSSPSSRDPLLTSTKVFKNARSSSSNSNNLRNANSTIRNLWKRNSPSLVDFSILSSSSSSSSLSTLPLNILLQESSNSATSICQKLSSISTTTNNDDVLTTSSIIQILLNGARIGYAYQQDNSCPGTSNNNNQGIVEPKITISDLIKNITNYSNNNTRNFSISFAPLSFGSNFDDYSLCTLQIRFKIYFDVTDKIPVASSSVIDSNKNNFYSDVAILNQLAIDFCDLLTNSMDKVVWNDLSCNFQQKAPGNGTEADNTIVGVQVQLLQFDENILGTPNSGVGGNGSGVNSYCYCFVSLLFLFVIL